MRNVPEHVSEALSGRYAVEREVGSGATATVYLARDLKHDRQVALKVLKPAVAAALGADRFLREIDIAAHLNHPHILPLHDSGEADGLLYFVMPYVAGESLRDRIDQNRQLPVTEAVRIAGQVAGALDYAHRQGVVHRDIKPGNILLSSGEAVVTDFGIARALESAAENRLTQFGTSPGTLAYMSPEQVAGEDLDGRSDLYSLACVLYEMLAGSVPFPGTNAQVILALKSGSPPSVSAVRETVPDALEQVLIKALARVPADRYPTGAELAAALAPFATGTHATARAPSPPRQLRNRLTGAVAAVAIAIVALVALVRDSGGIDFQERDWIVIADLENRTGDEVFDLSLNTAMTVAVDQSQYVNVYPRSRVTEALGRMGREDGPLDAELAREVAIRENIKAILAFEIANIDSTYIVTTRLVDAMTGVAVESETAQADRKADVLSAVDDLARRIRASLGESMRAIRTSVQLPLATTPSLDALKRFSDGSAAWSDSRWTEARTLWQEAVALDSSFAWAHASLGLAANWLEGQGAGAPHFQRAEALLDRVTDKERLWIRSLIRDGEEGIDALRTYTRMWPDDRDAWYNLGNNLRFLNRSEEALDAYSHAIAIDSMCPWCYVNSAMVYDLLGRDAEAAAAFDRAFELDPQSRTQVAGDLNRFSGFAMVKLGDTASARSRFSELLTGDADSKANGLRSLALLDMYHGHAASAIDKLNEAVALMQASGARLSEFRNRLYLASAYRMKGLRENAARERIMADRIAREITVGPAWLLVVGRQHARAGDTERAIAVLDAMSASIGAASPVFDQSNLEVMRGEVAVATGDHVAARNATQAANGLWRSPDRLESLAYAAYVAERWVDAEAAYRELLASQRLGDELQEHWIEAHHRLADVLEHRGDTAGAIEYYRRFLNLWKDGDADLAGVATVRDRLAHLAGMER